MPGTSSSSIMSFVLTRACRFSRWASFCRSTPRRSARRCWRTFPTMSATTCSLTRLAGLTGHTSTTAEQLQLDRARTRERGYAVEREEAVLGDVSVASAIFDRGGQPIGAVGVVAPRGTTAGRQGRAEGRHGGDGGGARHLREPRRHLLVGRLAAVVNRRLTRAVVGDGEAGDHVDDPVDRAGGLRSRRRHHQLGAAFGSQLRAVRGCSGRSHGRCRP